MKNFVLALAACLLLSVAAESAQAQYYRGGGRSSYGSGFNRGFSGSSYSRGFSRGFSPSFSRSSYGSSFNRGGFYGRSSFGRSGYGGSFNRGFGSSRYYGRGRSFGFY